MRQLSFPHGITQAEIVQMTKTNPARLLELEP
jgi:predicted metal-dependent phosphotriesterase family hydrolase